MWVVALCRIDDLPSAKHGRTNPMCFSSPTRFFAFILWSNTFTELNPWNIGYNIFVFFISFFPFTLCQPNLQHHKSKQTQSSAQRSKLAYWDSRNVLSLLSDILQNRFQLASIRHRVWSTGIMEMKSVNLIPNVCFHAAQTNNNVQMIFVDWRARTLFAIDRCHARNISLA